MLTVGLLSDAFASSGDASLGITIALSFSTLASLGAAGLFFYAKRHRHEFNQ
jgi:hypothetical protein